ncbi:endo alpha-1,4 polygalactosaminidase [Streptomyces sp. WMMC500]|uniref:endo alpha-1,4 polygalactosaminidase n=1 Tax=Streptomyces sp. WMMC500 TaxID=3015154 RepID=UPI00248C723F|nr:endo alpha-1,4 polygalactosaminidase [Streptomyces sp. WMMC500]WBB64116.1 endo alpha-1,4 polygalactosaminidase [Streptomyces sp. WMMC500]
MTRVRNRAAGAVFVGAALAGAAVVAAALLLAARGDGDEPREPALPPPGAGLDYQIGGAYDPPPGVGVVVRDRGDAPAPGAYNVCYVNAFQAQPGAEDAWDPDLLLRDADGEVVYDEDWGEAVLDLRTAGKRERIAAKVGRWIDGCAARGFQAVEPDNLDTYVRFPRLLTAAHARSYAALLTRRAHDRGLAVAQKNTPELAGDRARTGLDFAVAEECGAYDECAAYAGAFDDRVLVVEYTPGGLAAACGDWGDRLSVVRRDVAVSPRGAAGYVRETC